VARYKLVNEFEIGELRSTSIEVKLEQTNALMAAVHQMGGTQALADEEAEVRERWLCLKRAYGYG
jgi:hypothetical protein